MDDSIYSDKQKKDTEKARNVVWFFLMHAAVAIHRGNCFRAGGEMMPCYTDIMIRNIF
jgi:hypothetical protein